MTQGQLTSSLKYFRFDPNQSSCPYSRLLEPQGKYSLKKRYVLYYKKVKYWDRYVEATSAVPDQTAP